MSYLNPVRLTFKGKFQAAPSTVNNDPNHFNNETFDRKTDWAQKPGAQGGWWNPMGDASWRLIGCSVSSAWMGADQPVPNSDPVLSYLVADSDSKVSAKIVDLDPEQQLVSQVWGLQVRLARADGMTVLRGNFVPAAFTDIWTRAQHGNGTDIGASAVYQSVLENLEWGDIDDSPFLKELKKSSEDGLLSIKFNVDGYNISFGTPDFTLGRIVGTIGPSSVKEPKHFTLGRHFVAFSTPSPTINVPFFTPAGGINFCTAVVNEAIGKVFIDIGNALPTDKPGGTMQDIGALSLAWLSTDDQGNIVSNSLGAIDYKADGWYEGTAGVLAIPAIGKLTDDQLSNIKASQLALSITDATSGQANPAIWEPFDGAYLRPDEFVLRMNPGDRQEVTLYATQWGKSYSDALVFNFFDALQLQSQGETPASTSAVRFAPTVKTNADGVAKLEINTSDPGTPRNFIDGQVYGVRSVLADSLAYLMYYPVNPSDFVSILLWSGFASDSPPTWFGSIQPLLLQYANLYPVMSRFLDLGDYDSVCANPTLLRHAFSLPLSDPNSMPVTRDLSDAKRKAILTWLGPEGSMEKPLKGTPPGPKSAQFVGDLAKSSKPSIEISRGGKAAADARRMVRRLYWNEKSGNKEAK